MGQPGVCVKKVAIRPLCVPISAPTPLCPPQLEEQHPFIGAYLRKSVVTSSRFIRDFDALR